MPSKAFLNAFLTKSQDSSARIALCVDEYFLNYIALITRKNHNWNRLDETVLYASHDAFVFWNFAYHFRMLHNVINNLIPTGIMKQLVEIYFTKKLVYSKFEDYTKVLSVDDLLFGFKIWLGSCLISFVALVGEKIHSWYKAPKKVRFEKIRPLEINLEEVESVLTTELIHKFRVIRQNQSPAATNANVPEIVVEVHRAMDDDDDDDLSMIDWKLFD
jgi:hypothetical protein